MNPRVVSVPARRLPAWLAGFTRRHPGAQLGEVVAGWVLQAPDGALARIEFPAWAEAAGLRPTTPAELAGRAAGLTYGVVIVRRAGYLVAVVSGAAVASGKVGARHIHGRTAAGGWSQQRYARRRANQADEIAAAAAEHARAIFPTGPAGLVFLATGGDRRLLAATFAHWPQLAAIPRGPHLPVGTPGKDLLDQLPDLVCQIGIEVVEPAR